MSKLNMNSTFSTGVQTFVTCLMLCCLIGCGSSSEEYVSETVYDPTQGIVTEVKEVESELYKITDETIVEKKEDSRIIAEYLDGVRDTFTLDEARLVDADNPRRRGVSGILMGGMMGYMMGKRMSQPLSKTAYANDDAYKKSQSSSNKLKSTATKRTVKSKKKGYGSGKSSKSYGG